MNRKIILNESELNALISDAIDDVILEVIVGSKNNLTEGIDEGVAGMIGGLALRPITNKVIGFIANKLNLNKDSILYRVLTSRLFAMALGNEIQNSMKRRRKEKRTAFGNRGNNNNQTPGLDVAKDIVSDNMIDNIGKYFGNNNQNQKQRLGNTSPNYSLPRNTITNNNKTKT